MYFFCSMHTYNRVLITGSLELTLDAMDKATKQLV
jgi:hypothetical protein